MKHIPLQSEKNIIFNSKSPGSVPAVCWVVCVCLCASASGAVGKGRKEAGSHLPTPDSTTMPPLTGLTLGRWCFVASVLLLLLKAGDYTSAREGVTVTCLFLSLI